MESAVIRLQTAYICGGRMEREKMDTGWMSFNFI
jgi:hypothetical protein